MSEPQPTLNPHCYVNIGPHGSFAATGRLHTTPEDIRSLMAHLRTAATDRMVVHFHGGLVSEDDGIAGAERLIRAYSQTRAHPVCFIWETGLIETLRRNLADIHETKLFKWLIGLLARKLAKYLGVSVGAKGAGLEPDAAEIEAELARERPFDDIDLAHPSGAKGGGVPASPQLEHQVQAELELELSADPELRSLLAERRDGGELLRDELAAPVAPGAKGPVSITSAAAALARVVVRCVGRWNAGRDHGFYPTLMEEAVRELYLDNFGAWAWGNMKEIAEQMWLPNGDELGPDSHPGTLFLEELAKLQQERPGLVVDLVGHSAGSIAICHLLEANAERGIGVRIRNIALLAPAVRSDLFHAAVLAPELEQAPRCERLRVFTMKDNYESRDMLVPYVYTRSLLYLISGVLEADQVDCPILGMERYLTQAAPYDDERLVAIGRWLGAPDADRLVLSVTDDDAPPGLRSRSEHHGDFDNDDDTDGETMASVCHMIDA
jgi:hypothetical protein